MNNHNDHKVRIMKKNKNLSENGNGNGHGASSICIEFSHPTAVAVAIAGTFNNWKPDTTRMIAVGAGRWRKELVLPPGAHEYLLVADGEWIPDPSARETVANSFGGVNSVIRVDVPEKAGAM
jgi:1,4-alpha-glucan branching enzyme